MKPIQNKKTFGNKYLSKFLGEKPKNVGALECLIYVVGGALVTGFGFGFIGGTINSIKNWDTLLNEPNQVSLEGKTERFYEINDSNNVGAKEIRYSINNQNLKNYLNKQGEIK